MASDVKQGGRREMAALRYEQEGGKASGKKGEAARRYDKRGKNAPPQQRPQSTHVHGERRSQKDRRTKATSEYQMSRLDVEKREDEEEALERQEQARLRRHKHKVKGDGTISGRYMRKTFLEFDDNETHRKSVKIRDAAELRNASRLRDIRNVKSLVIEDETDSVDKLPDTVTEMAHIDELIIRYCRTKALPSKITNLNQVTTLTLNETHLKDMDAICNLRSLKRLDMSNNLLKHIPAAIGNLVVLETLNINGNHIQVLPSQLGQLQNLLHLSIASNRLHHLPDSLCKLTNLREIDASRNVLESIPDDLGHLSSLTTLNVGHNKLDYMPESLRSMRKLKFLYAPKNRLTEVGDGFTDLVSLEALHLQENNISKVSGCPAHVTVLLINNNKLKDVSLLWRALRKIRTLSLRSNVISELPEDVMAGAASIHSLYLDYNPIQFLPDALSHNHNMCHLTVSNTQVPHIPHGILHLPKLTLLETVNNRLDPQLQHSSLRGVEELRKAYDNFVPDQPPQLSAVQLRRNTSKAEQNGPAGVEKRSSKALDGSTRDEKRSSKALMEQQTNEEKRSSRSVQDGTLPREDKRSPRGATPESPLVREDRNSTKMQKENARDGNRSPRSAQDSTLPRDDKRQSRAVENPYSTEPRRLPRTNLENGERETNNNTLDKPKPNTKPKPAVQAKPKPGDKPEVSTKPQVNGGQKSSFLFSRPK